MHLRHCGCAALLLLAACGSTGGGTVVPPVEVSAARAEALFLDKRFSEAAQQYEALAQQAPETQKAYLIYQVGCCKNGTQEYDGAIARFTDALTHTLTEDLRLQIHFKRGVAYNGRWRPEMALLDFRRVQDAPKDVRESAVKTSEFQFRYGVTLMRTGAWAEGRQVLQNLVKDFPQGAEANDARERIPMTRYVIRITQPSSEVIALRRVKEAAAKGLATPEVMQSAVNPEERFVVVGKTSRFDDAVRELDRVKAAGYSDPMLMP